MHPSTTRRETVHGGSTPASLRVMVVDGYIRSITQSKNTRHNRTAFPGSLLNTTHMDVGSAENAGAIFSRPTWMWEVRKMHGAIFCPSIPGHKKTGSRIGNRHFITACIW
jgi:hypothetical protein